MGTMQDIGTAAGPSNSLSTAGITRSDWYSVGGGEAGFIAPDPSDPNIVYAGEYGGYISRFDYNTRQARNISIYPTNPSGHGAEDLRLSLPVDRARSWFRRTIRRWSITPPTSCSARADGGQTWKVISPDLTRNDKSKQKWSGGPITGDNTGVEVYDTIFAIAESPREKGLLWAGSDDGLVHVTRDGGKTWNNVTKNIPGMPEWGTVACIEPGHFDAGTAYLVVDAHRLDDDRPYLWKTADFGKTWKSLAAELPAGRLSARGPRRPETPGPALPRHRARRHVIRATTARPGRSCASTCRPCRSTIWWSRTTTWWSARTAGRCGFSTT